MLLPTVANLQINAINYQSLQFKLVTPHCRIKNCFYLLKNNTLLSVS